MLTDILLFVTFLPITCKNGKFDIRVHLYVEKGKLRIGKIEKYQIQNAVKDFIIKETDNDNNNEPQKNKVDPNLQTSDQPDTNKHNEKKQYQVNNVIRNKQTKVGCGYGKVNKATGYNSKGYNSYRRSTKKQSGYRTKQKTASKFNKATGYDSKTTKGYNSYRKSTKKKSVYRTKHKTASKVNKTTSYDRKTSRQGYKSYRKKKKASYRSKTTSYRRKKYRR